MTLKTRKRKPFIVTLNTGIFSAPVVFSVGFKYDEMIKKLGKEWADPLAEDKELIDNGSCFALKRSVQINKRQTCDFYYIIFDDEFTFSDTDMCLLAHEIHHICTFYLRDLLDITKEFECVAYTHSHLMKQCLEALREYHTK